MQKCTFAYRFGCLLWGDLICICVSISLVEKCMLTCRHIFPYMWNPTTHTTREVPPWEIKIGRTPHHISPWWGFKQLYVYPFPPMIHTIDSHKTDAPEEHYCPNWMIILIVRSCSIIELFTNWMHIRTLWKSPVRSSSRATSRDRKYFMKSSTRPKSSESVEQVLWSEKELKLRKGS